MAVRGALMHSLGFNVQAEDCTEPIGRARLVDLEMSIALKQCVVAPVPGVFIPCLIISISSHRLHIFSNIEPINKA
jgi:hypothetical protein